MPYRVEWVEPALFLRHKGVSVYHVYVDDDVTKPKRQWVFGLSPTVSDSSYDGEEGRFDVRNLPAGSRGSSRLSTQEDVRRRVCCAIDGNVIPSVDDVARYRNGPWGLATKA